MKDNKHPATNNPKEPVKISRKEAMKKAGKYAAFTAGSMLFLFSPLDAQTDSMWPDEPGFDW